MKRIAFFVMVCAMVTGNSQGVKDTSLREMMIPSANECVGCALCVCGCLLCHTTGSLCFQGAPLGFSCQTYPAMCCFDPTYETAFVLNEKCSMSLGCLAIIMACYRCSKG